MKGMAVFLALAAFAMLASAIQCQDLCNDYYTMGLSLAQQYQQGKWYSTSERPESVTSGLACPPWTPMFDSIDEGQLRSANQVCYTEERSCRNACNTEACGDVCEDGAQQCCHNATLRLLAEAKANCLSRCGAATPTPTPSLCDYERSVNSLGQVTTEAAGGATRFRVGGDGSATITYTKRGTGGSPAITVRLFANTDFKLEPCTSPSQLAGGSGASLSGEGRVLRLSSEHGSIRGSINGGGDFIRGPEPNELRLNPLPVPDRGRVSIVESGAAGAPEFITEVSLRTGRMRIVSMGGYSDYSVTPNVAAIAQPPEGGARLDAPPPYSEGAVIAVNSGSVFVSDAATGRGKTLSAGESDLVTMAELASIATPTPVQADCGRHYSCGDCALYAGCGWSKAQGRCLNGTMAGSGDGSSSGSDWAWTSGQCPAVSPTATIPGNATLECREDMDCPGTQLCENGRCVESSCCGGFILLVLGAGAVVLLARRAVR